MDRGAPAGAYERDGLRYPSDLTDAEWALVEPFISPAKRGGRKRTVDVCEVLNGIFYVLATGCQWRALPKDLPPKSTVHGARLPQPVGLGRHARAPAPRLVQRRVESRSGARKQLPLPTHSRAPAAAWAALAGRSRERSGALAQHREQHTGPGIRSWSLPPVGGDGRRPRARARRTADQGGDGRQQRGSGEPAGIAVPNVASRARQRKTASRGLWRRKRGLRSYLCLACASDVWDAGPRNSSVGSGFGGCPLSQTSPDRRVPIWDARVMGEFRDALAELLAHRLAPCLLGGRLPGEELVDAGVHKPGRVPWALRIRRTHPAWSSSSMVATTSARLPRISR